MACTNCNPQVQVAECDSSSCDGKVQSPCDHTHGTDCIIVAEELENIAACKDKTGQYTCQTLTQVLTDIDSLLSCDGGALSSCWECSGNNIYLDAATKKVAIGGQTTATHFLDVNGDASIKDCLNDDCSGYIEILSEQEHDITWLHSGGGLESDVNNVDMVLIQAITGAAQAIHYAASGVTKSVVATSVEHNEVEVNTSGITLTASDTSDSLVVTLTSSGISSTGLPVYNNHATAAGALSSNDWYVFDNGSAVYSLHLVP